MEHPNSSSGSRAEAERWLLIADKLLTSRDLIGSKTFAIRARESDPGLEYADRILAVADTLIAAESRFNNQHDWYSILQLVRPTHDLQLIATQYRRLALLLNPNRNKLAFADEAFKLVSDAWSVLSNPSRKSLYDNEHNLCPKLDPIVEIGLSRAPEHPKQQEEDYNKVNQQQQPVWKSPRRTNMNDKDQVNQQQQTIWKSPRSTNMNDKDQVNQQQPVWKSPRSTRINDKDEVNQQQQAVRRSSRSVNINDKDQVNQQQHTGRRSPRSTNINDKEKVVTEEPGIHNTDNQTSSFWTACPYCYYMYEYPRVFEDCTLRCQNCSRAFHALVIPSPPPISEGKEAYFCCWSLFPLGVSMSNLEKNKGGVRNWTPFSPMFTCPQVVPRQNVVDGNVDVVEENVNVTAPRSKKVNSRKSLAPRIYIEEDQDAFVEISESDDSDDEWGSTRKKKKAKNVKGKDLPAKNMKTPQVEKGKNVRGGSGENSMPGAVVQDGLGVSNVSYAGASKKAVPSKKQTVKVAKESGKLDLNVEFSNEVEEPVLGMSEGNAAGNGEEDGIEFFEGLDEFLNTLPILSVVGDNKVKAT
ncbi:uncharacterized protein LOC132294236 [Cornus florida]|uniref:uncharacterized protein LOC132294236 n=1 Tax=Cornus florida TaxID=4283 RepID=UPI00289F49AD|nr:uncharacterized protein LOC132294236 [Cornus florida]